MLKIGSACFIFYYVFCHQINKFEMIKKALHMYWAIEANLKVHLVYVSLAYIFTVWLCGKGSFNVQVKS